VIGGLWYFPPPPHPQSGKIKIELIKSIIMRIAEIRVQPPFEKL